MGLFDDFDKIIKMQAIVDASKDKEGKPNSSKAGAIALGLGYTSFEDTV